MAKCAQCGQGRAQRDGLCPACRLRAHGCATPKYAWTEALRGELRAAYALPKPQRAAALRALMARTGWPHHVLRNEASRIRLTRGRVVSVRIRPKPLDYWTSMDVRCVFSVERTTIESWFRRGLFGAVRNGRVSAKDVVRFIRKYPHEYDLRRVDQVLYKALVFGRMAEVD